MKKIFLAVLLLVCSSVAFSSVIPCFSPKGGCAAQIIAEVNKAKLLIWVQMYVFTNMDIAKALAAAKARGVDVKIILDNGGGLGYETEKWLISSSGIPIWVDHKHATAHSKVMIIDTTEVITGSYNYTYTADLYNAEDNLVLKGYTVLPTQFKANFNLHLSHSVLTTVPLTVQPQYIMYLELKNSLLKLRFP